MSKAKSKSKLKQSKSKLKQSKSKLKQSKSKLKQSKSKQRKPKQLKSNPRFYLIKRISGPPKGLRLNHTYTAEVLKEFEKERKIVLNVHNFKRKQEHKLTLKFDAIGVYGDWMHIYTANSIYALQIFTRFNPKDFL